VRACGCSKSRRHQQSMHWSASLSAITAPPHLRGHRDGRTSHCPVQDGQCQSTTVTAPSLPSWNFWTRLPRQAGQRADDWTRRVARWKWAGMHSSQLPRLQTSQIQDAGQSWFIEGPSPTATADGPSASGGQSIARTETFRTSRRQQYACHQSRRCEHLVVGR
jgi:hypothetical protein